MQPHFVTCLTCQRNALFWNMKILEACVDSLSQALKAQSLGAHRIELCSQLDLDGLSPSREMIESALAQLDIPVKVMIRPRAGDFIYSEKDLQVMEEEIEFCKKTGVDEIVLGASLPGGELDIKTIRRLAKVADPMTITIHKAIDLCPDPLAELEKLRPITNVTHILSSGKKPTALEGAPLLREMIEVAGDRFTIIAAGKVTRENLEKVHLAIGTSEYHGKQIAGNLDP